MYKDGSVVVAQLGFKRRATAVSNQNKFQPGDTFLVSLVRPFGVC